MRTYLYNTVLNQRTRHNKLVREKEVSYNMDEEFTSPFAVHKVMTRLFGMDKKAEEYMFMVALNTKCYPLGFFEISHGTVNTTIVSPREIFVRATLVGATNIIIVHNHPSKNSTASMEDIKVTKRIKEAGELLGINLIDHVIIGGKSYNSLKERGVI